MRRRSYPVAVLAVCLVLTGCSNSDNDEDSPPLIGPPEAPAERGAPIGSPERVDSFSPAEILALFTGDTFEEIAVALSLAPRCSIDVYQIRYGSVGGWNEQTESSGALMVPTGTDAACQGPRPVLVYAHGTEPERDFNIAAVTAEGNNEGVLIAAVFAGEGYIVVAPNYAGYDTSTLPYHPYLVADQQAADMIDALTAARSVLPSLTSAVSDSGKLFITGYSQGGYVAMATHRAMQAAGSVVTASGPMSGPYTLSAFGDAIFMGQVNLDAVLNLNLLIEGYQNTYGNLFTDPTEIFANPQASEAVFSDMPPAPEYAGITPPIQPVQFAQFFARGFGPVNLITNSYRLAYLRDAETAPDGGVPVLTDGLPPANPTHPLRQALKTNDLRNWVPTSPVLLCAGNSDPTVFFFNTELMRAHWAARDPTAPVTVLDVDSPVATDDPFAGIKESFATVKDLVTVTEGETGMLELYHAGLVPPFCLRAVKDFFDAL
ncbi:MAG TPA: prolyl oligopeptidase family serine peptidase [Steroidobacteraceae bacterium]